MPWVAAVNGEGSGIFLISMGYPAGAIEDLSVCITGHWCRNTA